VLRKRLEAFCLSGCVGRGMRLPVKQEREMFHVEHPWVSRLLGSGSLMSGRRACDRGMPRTHATLPSN
jgi:hypothetical protein